MPCGLNDVTLGLSPDSEGVYRAENHPQKLGAAFIALTWGGSVFGEDSSREAAGAEVTSAEATGADAAEAAGASTSADLAALFPCKKWSYWLFNIFWSFEYPASRIILTSRSVAL